MFCRVLLHRHDGGAVLQIMPVWNEPEFWVCGARGLHIGRRGVCFGELPTGVLLLVCVSPAAVSGGYVCEHDGCDVCVLLRAVHGRCGFILRVSVDVGCRCRVPHGVFVRWWRCCARRVRLQRGLRLSERHVPSRDGRCWVVRHNMSRGIFLCGLDAPHRVPGW